MMREWNRNLEDRQNSAVSAAWATKDLVHRTDASGGIEISN